MKCRFSTRIELIGDLILDEILMSSLSSFVSSNHGLTLHIFVGFDSIPSEIIRTLNIRL